MTTNLSNSVIIFLIHNRPWNEFELKRFGIEYANSNGFDIRPLTMSPYSFSKFFCELPTIVKTLFSNRKNCIVIPLFRLTIQSLLFFQILSFFKIPFYFLLNASNPASGLSVFSHKILNFNIISKLNALLIRMPLWSVALSSAKGIVIDGLNIEPMAKRICPPSSKKTDLLFSYSLDYLKMKLFQSNVVQSDLPCIPFAVFIDQAMDCHPDFLINDAKPPVSLNYNREMNTFFGEIKKQLGLEVVIAAHPKRTKDFSFGNHKLFYGKTDHLIENSKLVLGHCSTALGIAAMRYKPICIITTAELASTSWTNASIVAYANSFGVAPLFADKPPKDISQYICKVELQRKYINDFIKHPYSSELFWWELVLQHHN